MTLITRSPTLRRLKRVRSKLLANPSLPRLTVFRSHRHLWAQIIDDQQGKTLSAATTKNLEVKGTKTQKAAQLGQLVASLAINQKITTIKFDRGPYRYHGRIKALAEAARRAGLKF